MGPRAASGGHSIVFNRAQSLLGLAIPMQVACGQCIGCRLDRSRDWGIRCVHEASLYKRNCFLTLTYNDKNLPSDRSLDYRHFQLFMKRLRKRFGADIRFFMCGEYGERHSRPHYHAIIFNFDFDDKTPWRKSKSGFILSRSQSLEELWTFGNSEIGTVTFESAAYCARYITKKITGSVAADFYTDIDQETGLITERVPEFCHMSLKPGIALGWLEKYHRSDVAPHDHVIVRDMEVRPPRYYDAFFQRYDPAGYELMKKNRVKACNKADNTPDRLSVKERVAYARLDNLVRSFEKEMV